MGNAQVLKIATVTNTLGRVQSFLDKLPFNADILNAALFSQGTSSFEHCRSNKTPSTNFRSLCLKANASSSSRRQMSLSERNGN